MGVPHQKEVIQAAAHDEGAVRAGGEANVRSFIKGKVARKKRRPPRKTGHVTLMANKFGDKGPRFSILKRKMMRERDERSVYEYSFLVFALTDFPNEFEGALVWQKIKTDMSSEPEAK